VTGSGGVPIDFLDGGGGDQWSGSRE